MPEINDFAFSVHDAFHGIRVDSFLVRQLRNYTPFRMQRMIRCGAVLVDGEPAELSRRVRRGERVLAPECILCQECINACDHQALSLSFDLDLGGLTLLRERGTKL